MPDGYISGECFVQYVGWCITEFHRMVERDPWDTLRADKSLGNLNKTPTWNRALMAPCRLAEGVHLGYSFSNKINA